MTKKIILTNSMFRAVIASFLIFLLFYPLFLVKTKVFIFQGQIETDEPLDLTLYISPSQEHETLKTLFYKHIEQSGKFHVEMRENKLFGFQIVIQAKSDKIIWKNLSLIGAKKIPLSFENAVFEGVIEKTLSHNGQQAALKINPAYSSIVFHNISLPRAKRIYHLTPLTFICFLPIIWCLWRSPRKETINNIMFLLFPLMLLMVIKYCSFEHSYHLYYQKISLHNLWCLEQYEFIIFALVYALLAGAISFSKRWLKAICWVLLIVLTMILTVDGVVLHNLNARFIFAEMANYGSEYATAFHMLVSYLGTVQGRLMVLFCLSVWAIGHYQSRFSKCCYRYTLWLVAGFFVAASLLFKNNFLFDYAFYNVFEANQGTHQKRAYSESFVNKLKDSFAPEQSCIKGLNRRKNVIVIIAESLSVFSSHKLSGLHDYMPRLDNLMDKNAVYSSYYSNSYNTSSGIFSLISGLPSIHGFEGLSGGEGDVYYGDSLAQRLAKFGYKTYFLTAVEPNGPLEDIMYRSHFDEVSDYRDPYYQDKPKIVFNAPADEYLFANTLERIATYRDKAPFLMVVSTITGHGPYIHPHTKEASFEKTVGYVDDEIDKFISALEKMKFFNNGMVLITGDHRAMLPVSSEENIRLSPLAEGRVPLVIIDKEIKGEKKAVFSHNDVAPSLQYYLTSEGCFNKFQNNLFDNHDHENCILYQKLSPRDKVVVLCDHSQSVICLNGDETAYCEGHNEKMYVDYVNWLRLLPQL